MRKVKSNVNGRYCYSLSLNQKQSEALEKLRAETRLSLPVILMRGVDVINSADDEE